MQKRRRSARQAAAFRRRIARIAIVIGALVLSGCLFVEDSRAARIIGNVTAVGLGVALMLYRE